jgi:bifunctional pyridoxal-dependent enzyme with beta-cystathionase and maltose regulon repressor activities
MPETTWTHSSKRRAFKAASVTLMILSGVLLGISLDYTAFTDNERAFIIASAVFFDVIAYVMAHVSWRDSDRSPYIETRTAAK